MTDQRLFSMKPVLLQDILGLPARELHQVMTKISLLAQDPQPDGKTRRQIKHMSGKLYRVRAGNYRILYTFDQKSISVLTIRRRNESTYKDEVELDTDLDGDELCDLDNLLNEATSGKSLSPDRGHHVVRHEGTPFPEPITIELLLISLQSRKV